MSINHFAESGDIKASVAVLSFIFSSAAKHDVDSESLSSELQQLGLPKGKPVCLCPKVGVRINAVYNLICTDLFSCLNLCQEQGQPNFLTKTQVTSLI